MRRTSSWFLGLALVSAVLAAAVSVAASLVPVPSRFRWYLAILPLAPLVLMFFGIARWLRGLDELQRLIHLEAFALQFAATGLLVMGYGMLARVGAVPDVPMSGAYPFLWLSIFGFWAFGLILVRRKYR